MKSTSYSFAKFVVLSNYHAFAVTFPGKFQEYGGSRNYFFSPYQLFCWK